MDGEENQILPEERQQLGSRDFLLPEKNLRTPYDHTKCGLISYDDTIRSSRILGEEKRIKFWKKNVGSILARHAPGSNKT